MPMLFTAICFIKHRVDLPLRSTMQTQVKQGPMLEPMQAPWKAKRPSTKKKQLWVSVMSTISTGFGKIPHQFMRAILISQTLVSVCMRKGKNHILVDVPYSNTKKNSVEAVFK